MESYMLKKEYTPKKLIKKFVRQLTFRKKENKSRHPIQTIEGNFSMTAIRGCQFPGHQSAATAVCALLQSKCLSPAFWSPRVLDKLLLQGDKLHTTRVHHLGRLAHKDGYLTVQELPTNFTFKHKEFNLTLTTSERYSSNTNPCDISDLVRSLKGHFLGNQDGVLFSSGDTTLAVFVDDTYCYLFNPCKDTGSLSVSKNSQSVLLKFRDFHHLAMILNEKFLKETTQMTAVQIDINFDVWTEFSFSRSFAYV